MFWPGLGPSLIVVRFQSLACNLNNAWPCGVKSLYVCGTARMMLISQVLISFACLISHWNKLLYDFFFFVDIHLHRLCV